jgi:hypothetical protein
MKLKRYNQLFEKDIKDILPEDYLSNIKHQRAGQYQGGPSRQEMMESMRMMDEIFRLQRGHEDELTKIGKDIIKDHYGSILDDINLDIKIVSPNDEEKLDMTKRMGEDKPEEQEDDFGSGFEVPIEVDEDDVSKRKLANLIMQGEAQNVHSMMHTAKEDIDEISPELLDLYSKHLEINRKFDWDENRPDMSQFMEDHPEMANAMEVEYPKEDEDENKDIEKITIKARVLDLPMLIHETVKGIYELMTAKAIPEDPIMAAEIMKYTDTLEDEEEDIKYGPYIAADLRNYINNYLEQYHKKSLNIPNLREFVFSEMIELDSGTFVNLIKSILTGDVNTSEKIIKDNKIVENAIESTSYEEETQQRTPEDFEGYVQDDVADTDTPDDNLGIEIKDKGYADMNKSELNDILNQAIDNGDFETMKNIQQYL